MTVWMVWVGSRLNSVHETEDLAQSHKVRLLEVNGDQLPVRCEPIEFMYSDHPGMCPDHPGPLDDATDHVCRLRPELVCHRCHRPNITWCAPSPLWNAVMRSGGSIDGDDTYDGIVCPICFAMLAEEKGVATGVWRVDAGEVTSVLETKTPSGRLWDSEEGLWKSPEVTQ